MAATLCAVVTAYRPDAAFAARFAQVAASCRAVVVVDNTPGGHEFVNLNETFVVVQDGRNKGLGKALNLGIERARQLGCDTVVLFDQDSSPSSTLIEGLSSVLDSMSDERTVVGPLHVDDQTGLAASPLGKRDTGPVRIKSCLPTSGMIFRVDEWSTMPHFPEDLFLDLVDFDWCWQLGRRGWRCYTALEVPMLHRLGEGQRKLLGMTYHVPAPYRHYFQFRDTLRIATRRYVPLYSRFRLVGILPLKLLAYPWLMDDGSERIGWMLRGIADAALGRSGAGAAARKLGA